MTKFFCKQLLLFIAIGLSGCITSPYTATSEALTKYKRIGVISTVAQTFNRSYAGITAFGNESESIDISSWELDDIFEEKISKEVAALNKYKLVKMNVRRSEFLKIMPSSGVLGHLGSVVTYWGSYSKILGNYCNTNQVDAILLVHPLLVSYSNSNIEGLGVGMYAGPNLGEKESHIDVNAAISLVDCTSLKPISSKELLAFHFDKAGKYELDTYPNGKAKLFSKPVPYEVAKTPLNKLDKKLFESFKEQFILMTNDSWKPNIRQTLLGIDVDINSP